MMKAKAANQTAGFTLVEVMLSVSLMVIVVGAAYACLSAGFEARKLVDPRVDAIQSGRVALSLLTSDLRSGCVLPGGSDFLGVARRIGEIQADSIDFATRNYSPARPQEGDFCELSYFVDRDPKSGQLCLWRRRNPMIALDPLEGGRREEIARGVRGFQLEYYDGLEWYDSWGEPPGAQKQATSARYRSNLSGLPDAVRVTLFLDSEGVTSATNTAPPMVFRSVAFLNLAANAYARSRSASESSSGTPGTADQGAQFAPVRQ